MNHFETLMGMISETFRGNAGHLRLVLIGTASALSGLLHGGMVLFIPMSAGYFVLLTAIALLVNKR